MKKIFLLLLLISPELIGQVDYDYLINRKNNAIGFEIQQKDSLLILYVDLRVPEKQSWSHKSKIVIYSEDKSITLPIEYNDVNSQHLSTTATLTNQDIQFLKTNFITSIKVYFTTSLQEYKFEFNGYNIDSPKAYFIRRLQSFL